MGLSTGTCKFCSNEQRAKKSLGKSGPWYWSTVSRQHAHVLLWRSEFKSHWLETICVFIYLFTIFDLCQHSKNILNLIYPKPKNPSWQTFASEVSFSRQFLNFGAKLNKSLPSLLLLRCQWTKKTKCFRFFEINLSSFEARSTFYRKKWISKIHFLNCSLWYEF